MIFWWNDNAAVGDKLMTCDHFTDLHSVIMMEWEGVTGDNEVKGTQA
jgi:hypothetical protein